MNITTLSLSLNDTTTAHNTLGSQIDDWPEQIKRTAPTRDSYRVQGIEGLHRLADQKAAKLNSGYSTF